MKDMTKDCATCKQYIQSKPDEYNCQTCTNINNEKNEMENIWIPVSEKLPDEGKEVLIYHQDLGIIIAFYVIDDRHIEGEFEGERTGWYYQNRSEYNAAQMVCRENEIMAWMPLPTRYIMCKHCKNSDHLSDNTYLCNNPYSKNFANIYKENDIVICDKFGMEKIDGELI